MICSINNSALDNEKLSHIFIPKEAVQENFDFSNVVVKKPWGYEYLLYDDGKASAWVLYLNKGSLLLQCIVICTRRLRLLFYQARQ